ncbi:MAG TPA: CHRD domain-containing protein [Thermoanaerobaculia bacterium]|nr:CHRD domain-containing protein [Thermoanaerobaculia bacterium]
MKRTLWLAAAICFFAAGTVRAQVVTYVAGLNGANETPNQADPDGVGFAVINIDQAAGSITFTAYAQNIASITASHIHRGAAGVTGPVIIPFNQSFTNGVSSGTLNGIAPSFLAEVIANPPGYYFNVHTTDFPGGAIRGQLRPAPGTAAPNVLYLPVTVKATGAKGENFIEDVRIVSRASAAANITIDYFASNAAGLAGPTSTKTVSVAVNQQLVLNDILGSTFGLTGPQVGALRFTTDRDVLVEGRILDDRRSSNQGQLGFFIHGLPIEAPCRFGTLPALSQASAGEVTAGIGLRTNIGYFNPNALPVSATFTARRTSDGSSLGAVTVTIPALSHAQFPVFSLINTVGAGDLKQEDFYVSYSVAAVAGVNVSGGPLFVYFAVGDNFSGDSYYSAGVCGQ